MKSTFKCFVSLTCLALTLSACQTPLPNSKRGTQETRSTDLTQQGARRFSEKLEASGRLSVTVLKDEKPQHYPVHFDWQQSEQALQIEFKSSLGQTLAQLRQDKQGASLFQPGKTLIEADTLNELLLATFGWDMPSEQMRYWLQGCLLQNESKELVCLKPETYQFQSQGWNVVFSTWYQQTPKRIDLNTYVPKVGEITIRVVLDPPPDETT